MKKLVIMKKRTIVKILIRWETLFALTGIWRDQWGCNNKITDTLVKSFTNNISNPHLITSWKITPTANPPEEKIQLEMVNKCGVRHLPKYKPLGYSVAWQVLRRSHLHGTWTYTTEFQRSCPTNSLIRNMIFCCTRFRCQQHSMQITIVSRIPWQSLSKWNSRCYIFHQHQTLKI